MKYVVLFTPMLLACATRHPVERRPIVNTIAVVVEGPILVIDSPECYTLTYSDSRNGASERYFPVWIALLPGKYGAAAEAKHNPALSDTQWAALAEFHAWRQSSADSIEVRFTGSYEGMSIRLPRKAETIRGRAVWITDVIGLPEASMRVTATREPCSSGGIAAKPG